MENNKKEPSIEELNKIIKFYKMEIYKKNITIKQLRYRIYIEENIRNKLTSKL
jgi:hypothetical protein